MDREKVYEAINSERDYQNDKWGTIEDHPHEVGGYLTLMRNLLTRAEKEWSENPTDDKALREIRKLLAVGVACCEQHGVNDRFILVPKSSKRN